jgi:hypothetical protein
MTAKLAHTEWYYTEMPKRPPPLRGVSPCIAAEDRDRILGAAGGEASSNGLWSSMSLSSTRACR